MKILITGAASGIGKACANYYAAQDIIAIDKQDVDLTNIQAIERFLSQNNEFDVMIHCAGTREIEMPHLLSLSTWRNIMDVNVTSSFLLSQKLIQKSINLNKPLTIVNISSVSGLQAEPNRAAYVTSKFALIGLTKQLAYQYGKQGIRVNAIAPGLIETPLTQAYFADAQKQAEIKASIPVGYWGKVNHVISLIDVCLTNNYINGAVLVCDGGWTIGRNI